MEHILDTNIYRNLVKDQSFFEVERLAVKIRNNETNLSNSIGIPIVVAMELISRLVIGDRALVESFKALCVLFHASSESSTSGKYYPPLDVILPKYFFNDLGPSHKSYQLVIPIAKELTENYDLQNVFRLQDKVKVIKAQIEFEKNEIRENLGNYLKSINEGKLDWEIFKTAKLARRKLFADLSDGKAIFYVALGMMERGYWIVGKELEQNQENWDKLREFHNKFYPAFAMMSSILLPVAHGNSLANPHDIKWNSIPDISLMVTAIYFSEVKGAILITEEVKMHEFYKANDMEDRIMNLKNFKNLVNI